MLNTNSVFLFSGKAGEPVYSSGHGGSQTTSPAALPRLRANLNPLTVRVADALIHLDVLA